jgi:hypothetical protein
VPELGRGLSPSVAAGTTHGALLTCSSSLAPHGMCMIPATAGYSASPSSGNRFAISLERSRRLNLVGRLGRSQLELCVNSAAVRRQLHHSTAMPARPKIRSVACLACANTRRKRRNSWRYGPRSSLPSSITARARLQPAASFRSVVSWASECLSST